VAGLKDSGCKTTALGCAERRVSACAESARDFHGEPLTGRVGDRRFRSKFVFPVSSLFRLRVSQNLNHATFPVPATSNAVCKFPALRPPVTSRLGL
jgi:hypothetical protein